MQVEAPDLNLNKDNESGAGMTKDNEDHPRPRYMEFEEDSPLFQVKMLAMRVDTLTKEKEGLERDLDNERGERRKLDDRVGKMEKSFQRGAGMLIILPVLGTIIGVLFAWGKVIFAPWLTK